MCIIMSPIVQKFDELIEVSQLMFRKSEPTHALNF